MAEEWFTLETGAPVGPFSANELREKFRHLPLGTLVWRQGMPGWAPAADQPELVPQAVSAVWQPFRASAGETTVLGLATLTAPFAVPWIVERTTDSPFLITLASWLCWWNLLIALFIGIFGVFQPVAVVEANPRARGRLFLVPVLNAVMWVESVLKHPLRWTAGQIIDFVTLGLPCLSLLPLLLLASLGVLLTESTARERLDAIGAAQRAYAAANGGVFAERLECLTRTAECVPGYAGTPLLAAHHATNTKDDPYRVELRTSASSGGWIALARPRYAAPNGLYPDRLHTYCADETGRVCAPALGTEPGLAPVGAGRAGSRCARYCAGRD